MKIVSFFILISFFDFSYAKEFKENIIVENCKACHNLKNHKTKKIPSLNELNRNQFVELMINYKNIKSDGVMHRISKVLTDEDINDIADAIYDR